MAKSPILNLFGKRVREERLKKKLSQEEFAELAELHRTYIGMIERGEKNITLENIEKIADALNIELKELLNFQENSLYKENTEIAKITAPTTFAKWAVNHIRSIIPDMKPAEGEGSDGSAKREYDLIYQLGNRAIRIEVKASRAVDKSRPNLPYHERLLLSTNKSGLFDMNSQQLKLTIFDILIMIGVWADKIRYWVMTPKEIKNSGLFSSGQHRGNKGYEGQMHIKTGNIDKFLKYEMKPTEILNRIKKL